MNPKIKDLLVGRLEPQGFSLAGQVYITDPEKDRYLVFARGEQKYLISVHSGEKQRRYNPRLESFKAGLNFAQLHNLYPLPIFDSTDGFFLPDNNSHLRETSGDLRKVSGLELIAEEIFGEVTYASTSDLFVVSFGTVTANYEYANPKSGAIPQQRKYPDMKTRKKVALRTNIPNFTLDSNGSLGRIKNFIPRYVPYPIIPDLRAQQLRDLHYDGAEVPEFE